MLKSSHKGDILTTSKEKLTSKKVKLSNKLALLFKSGEVNFQNIVKQIMIIAKTEGKMLLRSWITIFTGFMLIVIPLIFQSPLESGQLWTHNSAAYACNQGVVITTMMSASLVVASVYYKDKISDMPIIIFSNPVTPKTYCLGKFLGVYVYILLIGLSSNFVALFQPLLLGKIIIYSPLEFLKIFIFYTVPSSLIMVLVCYFIEILFSNTIITLTLPIPIFFFIENKFNSLFHFRINEFELSNLVKRNFTPELIRFITINRIYVLILSLVLLVASVSIFSSKKLLRL